MKTKYACRGLISLYGSFHNNRTISSTNLHVKNCRWGGGKEKEPRLQKQLAKIIDALFDICSYLHTTTLLLHVILV